MPKEFAENVVSCFFPEKPTDVAAAAVKFPKKKWVNFFCIDATDFLGNVSAFCVAWRKEFIEILDSLARDRFVETPFRAKSFRTNLCVR
jgi:hypothetical protein